MKRLAPVCWFLPAAFIGLCALGCQQSPVDPPAGELAAQRRIAGLEAQIAEGLEAEAEWVPWFQALSRLDDDAQLGRDFFVQAANGRLVWHERVARELAEGVADGLLVREAAALRELGVDLLVVPIPHRSVIFPEQVGPTPDRGIADLRVRELFLALEKQGVEIVDLVPAFRAAAERQVAGPDGDPLSEKVYLPFDFHWSPYGAQVAAEVLADRMRAYPWYEEVRRNSGRAHLAPMEPVYRTAVGSMARELIAAGKLPEGEGVSVFPRYPAAVIGERWSFVDRASPIVVIGNSFTQPFYGLTDGLLRHLGFRVDRISVAGLRLDTLMPRLRNRPSEGLETKKLVVWVFHLNSLPQLTGS